MVSKIPYTTEPNSKQKLSTLFYQTMPFGFTKPSVPINSTNFTMDKRFIHTAQHIPRTRASNSFDSKKFNYSLINETQTFLLDQPYQHKTTKNNLSMDITENKQKTLKWLVPRKRLQYSCSKSHKKQRPSTVNQTLFINTPNKSFTNFKAIKFRSIQTALPRKRPSLMKGENVNIKQNLNSRLSIDLVKHGFKPETPITEVLRVLAKRTSKLGSFQNSETQISKLCSKTPIPDKGEVEIQYPNCKTEVKLSDKEKLEEIKVNEFLSGSKNIEIELPNNKENKRKVLEITKNVVADAKKTIKSRKTILTEEFKKLGINRKMTANLYEPCDSPYLKLLEKMRDFDTDVIFPEVDHTLYLYLNENMYKVLKKEMLMKQSEEIKIISLKNKELNLIKEQYEMKKNGEKMDVDNIEYLLRNIRFCESLRKEQRYKMLESAEYKIYEKDEEIVECVNINDLYIVLHGIVNVYSNGKELIKILEEGHIFAEELYLESNYNPTGYSKYSCKTILLKTAKKPAEILIIPRETFSDLIYKEMKEELFHKLYTLKKCPLFEEIPIVELINFASNLQLNHKHYCEIIIRQGEVPQKCYIIASGACKSLYENIVKGSSEPSEYARKSQKKQPLALRFGNTKFSSQSPIKNRVLRDPALKLSKQNNEKLLNFSYNNQIVSMDQNTGKFTYKSHVILLMKYKQK